ncbi:MAG: branched-chain amino acid ABC transporter substrate-binding protein [Chloroflexota bacterium]
MKTWRLGAVVATVAIVAAACSSSGSTPAPSAAASAGASAAASAAAATCTGTLTIGTELPMSGGETANGEPTANGVKLLVDQINKAGGLYGCQLAVNVQDDAVNGVHDPQQGAKNIGTLAADPTVMGVVGPYNSNVAKAEVPISNEAGLLQCSPANTANEVTQPPGGDTLRTAHPDKIAYIRVATTDSIQGPAMADYMFQDLGVKSVYIIDDTETYGVGVADTFEAEFTKIGGTVVKRDSAPKSTSDYTPLFTSVAGQKPQGVYLAGTTPSGMGLALKQGRTVPGFETIPFGGPDGIADLGPAGTEGATITVAGAAAANLYGTVAGAHDIADPQAFTDAYKALFGTAPGAYSAAGYSCAQVIVESLDAAIKAGVTDPAALREAVRAHATTTTNKFDTQLGTISFDKYGDITTPFISYYVTDMTLSPAGWVFIKQVAFADPNAP